MQKGVIVVRDRYRMLEASQKKSPVRTLAVKHSDLLNFLQISSRLHPFQMDYV